MSEQDILRLEAKIDNLASEIRLEIRALHERVTRMAIVGAFVLGGLGLGGSALVKLIAG